MKKWKNKTATYWVALNIYLYIKKKNNFSNLSWKKDNLALIDTKSNHWQLKIIAILRSTQSRKMEINRARRWFTFAYDDTSFCIYRFANSDLCKRVLRGLSQYIYGLSSGPFGVNIYLRQLFQYPLSTLDDDANVCTFRAHIHSRLSAVVAVVSIVSRRKIWITKSSGYPLRWRKVEQLRRQLGAVTFTPVPASPRRVFVRGCLKRKGR